MAATAYTVEPKSDTTVMATATQKAPKTTYNTQNKRHRRIRKIQLKESKGKREENRIDVTVAATAAAVKRAPRKHPTRNHKKGQLGR